MKKRCMKCWLFNMWKDTCYREHDGMPFLKRYNLTLLGYSFRIHHWVDNAPKKMHSHAWWQLTIVLAGQYVEVTPEGRKMIRAPHVAWKPSSHIHTIQAKNCWTFMVLGREVDEVKWEK